MKKLVLSCLFMSLFVSFYSNTYQFYIWKSSKQLQDEEENSIDIIMHYFSCVFCPWISIRFFRFYAFENNRKTDYYLVDGCPPGTRYWGLYHRDRLEGIVGGCIKDIYWNEQYILVKIHYGANSDSIEGYYIVKMLPPVKKGVPWEKIRPLSKEEYGQKKLELHLNEEKMKHKSLFKRESK